MDGIRKASAKMASTMKAKEESKKMRGGWEKRWEALEGWIGKKD